MYQRKTDRPTIQVDSDIVLEILCGSYSGSLARTSLLVSKANSGEEPAEYVGVSLSETYGKVSYFSSPELDGDTEDKWRGFLTSDYIRQSIAEWEKAYHKTSKHKIRVSWEQLETWLETLAVWIDHTARKEKEAQEAASVMKPSSIFNRK